MPLAKLLVSAVRGGASSWRATESLMPRRAQCPVICSTGDSRQVDWRRRPPPAPPPQRVQPAEPLGSCGREKAEGSGTRPQVGDGLKLPPGRVVSFSARFPSCSENFSSHRHTADSILTVRSLFFPFSPAFSACELILALWDAILKVTLSALAQIPLSHEFQQLFTDQRLLKAGNASFCQKKQVIMKRQVFITGF